MLQYRMDEIPPPPQKPPQDWKGDKPPKPKPEDEDEQEEKKKS